MPTFDLDTPRHLIQQLPAVFEKICNLQLRQATQAPEQDKLDRRRHSWPFRIRELHPDNDSSLINQLLVDYCRQNQIALSRSRPLKKNNNSWVKQNNWTHVRKIRVITA